MGARWCSGRAEDRATVGALAAVGAFAALALLGAPVRAQAPAAAPSPPVSVAAPPATAPPAPPLPVAPPPVPPPGGTPVAPPAYTAAPGWGAPPQWGPPPGAPGVSTPDQPPGAQGWWGPTPSLYSVVLRSTEPGVTIEVHRKGERGAPLVSCPSDCRVLLPRGEYRFSVTAAEETVAGSRDLAVSGHQEILLDPDTTGHRWGGLGMGIAGPLVMVMGMVALIGCAYGCDDEAETVAVVGLLGGLTMTPVGWVMFGTSMKPEFEIRAQGPGSSLPRERRWASAPEGNSGRSPSPGLRLGIAF